MASFGDVQRHESLGPYLAVLSEHGSDSSQSKYTARLVSAKSFLVTRLCQNRARPLPKLRKSAPCRCGHYERRKRVLRATVACSESPVALLGNRLCSATATLGETDTQQELADRSVSATSRSGTTQAERALLRLGESELELDAATQILFGYLPDTHRGE
jgi:hypothetical protein